MRGDGGLGAARGGSAAPVPQVGERGREDILQRSGRPVELERGADRAVESYGVISARALHDPVAQANRQELGIEDHGGRHTISGRPFRRAAPANSV